MKKVISITLSGMVFQIEEDALQKLSAYLDSIKRYYGADGKEISDDIEANIAEKLKAKHGDEQKVIILADVEELIKVMGTVDQMEDKEKEQESHGEDNFEDEAGARKIKRLYRDKSNSILGGVCTGLAAYFSIDVVIVRLLFVGLALLNGVGIIIYLVMWFIVPQAKTSMQRLEMQGEPINLKNIEEKVKEKSAQIKEQGQKAFVSLKEQKSTFKKLASVPIVLIEAMIRLVKGLTRAILPILRWAIGLFMLMMVFFAFIFSSFWAAVLLFKIDSPLLHSDISLDLIAGTKAYYLTIVPSYLAFLFTMVIAIIVAASILRKKWLMNWIAGTVLFALIALCITVASVFGFELVSDYKLAHDKYVVENTVEKSFDIKDFNAISGKVNGKLIVEKADRFSIVAKGLRKDVDNLEFLKDATSTDGIIEMRVGYKERYYHSGFMAINEPLEIRIKMPKLQKVDYDDFWDYEIKGFSAAELETMKIIDSGRRNKEDLVGNDRDEHGCIPSAGYGWCESSGKCIRPWEEVCDDGISFSNTGIIKKMAGGNGEGLHLIYENEDATKAISELIFDEKSFCGDKKTRIMCMLLSVSDYGLSDGTKVEVKGEIMGDEIMVREIYKIQ